MTLSTVCPNRVSLNALNTHSVLTLIREKHTSQSFYCNGFGPVVPRDAAQERRNAKTWGCRFLTGPSLNIIKDGGMAGRLVPLHRDLQPNLRPNRYIKRNPTVKTRIVFYESARRGRNSESAQIRCKRWNMCFILP